MYVIMNFNYVIVYILFIFDAIHYYKRYQFIQSLNISKVLSY